LKKETGVHGLDRFGFTFQKGGAHLARTMMLHELETLLACVRSPDAQKADYLKAIENDNGLGKRSGKTRRLTARHLVALYGLDPSLLLWRALLFWWHRDPSGRPTLAFLCAYSRDPLLRAGEPFIQSFAIGQIVAREKLEEHLEEMLPERFSRATLKSTAQNIASTWTQSGRLSGRVKKTRTASPATAGAVAYALLLGYLSGARGESLFSSEYGKLLDCEPAHMMAMAEIASRKGWIVFKHIGRVVEVLFPNILTTQEMEWVREQA
jgi:hypothetical protein